MIKDNELIENNTVLSNVKTFGVRGWSGAISVIETTQWRKKILDVKLIKMIKENNVLRSHFKPLSQTD